MYVQGPSVYGHVPAFTNPIPIYGQIESTALGSEVDDERLRVCVPNRKTNLHIKYG